MRKLFAVLMVAILVLSFATPALAEDTLVSEEETAIFTGDTETSAEAEDVNDAETLLEDTEDANVESEEVFLETGNSDLITESDESDETDEIDYPEPDWLNVEAEAAAGKIFLSWTELDEIEGDTLVGYTAYCYPANASYEDGIYQTYTTDEAVYTHVFSDVTDDVTYNVGVTAIYASGYEISHEDSVTPYSAGATVPGMPTIVSVTPGNGCVTVVWKAPEDNGGAVILGYEVDVVGEFDASSMALDAGDPDADDNFSCTVDYLTNGETYTVSVRAYNAVGVGEAGIASEQVTLPRIPVTLLVGGVTVTVENMDDVLGDGTVSYDPDTNTLTLNGAEILVSDGHYGIRNTGTLNICLQGQNKVICSGTYGIYSTDDMVIDGSGSLEVSGADFGIRIAGGYEIGGLTLCGDVKVTAVGEGAAYGSCYGVQVDDVLTVCDNAELNASAGAAPERSCAVYAYDIVEIYDNASVTAAGGDLVLDWTTDSVGVRTTHVIIDGGSLTATGGASGSSNGIFTSTFDMYAGTVTASGGTTDGQGPSVGLQANKSLELIGGTVKATGGNAGDEQSCGILTGGGVINISGGDVIAQGGNSDYSYGIRAHDLVISGGHVTAYGGEGVWCSDGVSVENMMTICGGYVNAKGRTAENFSYGIQASAADITSGEVYASGGSAAKSYGLWVFSQLNILCDEIRLNSNSVGFTGTILTLTAEDGYPFYTFGGVTMDDALTITEPSGGQFKRTDLEYTIVVDSDGLEAQRVVIKPLVYKVTMHGLSESTTRAAQVPAGWSLNQVYCEAFGVEDFSQLLETEKDGYTFGGWFAEDGSEFDFGTPITADITIYAKWIEDTLPDEPSPDEPSPDIKPTPTPGNTPEEDTKSEGTIPNTGDDSLPEMWLGIMITFAATLFGLQTYKIRSKKNKA